MSKEKQIEEMAAILLETSRQDSNGNSNKGDYAVFDVETIFKYGCDRLNGSTALYNAGYRKQIEGVWIVDGNHNNRRAKCTNCEHEYAVQRGMLQLQNFSFCPNCGAKMKGA